jgi:hypothetical protein
VTTRVRGRTIVLINHGPQHNGDQPHRKLDLSGQSPPRYINMQARRRHGSVHHRHARPVEGQERFSWPPRLHEPARAQFSAHHLLGWAKISFDTRTGRPLAGIPRPSACRKRVGSQRGLWWRIRQHGSASAPGHSFLESTATRITLVFVSSNVGVLGRSWVRQRLLPCGVCESSP